MAEAATYRTLHAAIAREAHDEVIDVCRPIVQNAATAAATATSSPSLSPFERKVWHALIVALLHDNQDAEALRFIEAEPYLSLFARATADAQFLHAYSLYRAKRPREALAVLQSLTSASSSSSSSSTLSPDVRAGVAHLWAQATYRAEQYSDAVALYDKHFTSAQLLSDVELASNVLSALLSAGEHAKALNLIRQGRYDTAPSTYEVAYNAASCLIEQGNLSAAVATLDKAIEVCRDTLLKDGASEEEVADESAALVAQKAYALHVQNRTDDALRVYQQVLATSPSDSSVVAVATSNTMAIKLAQDPSDAAAAAWIKQANSSGAAAAAQLDTTAPGEEKMMSKQKQIVQLNRCLLWLRAKHADKCRAQLNVLQRAFPHFEPAVLVHAALLSSEKKFADAEAMLETFVRQQSARSSGAVAAAAAAPLLPSLAIVQLRLARGDLAAALDAVHAINATTIPPTPTSPSSPSARYPVAFQSRPATLALIVALNERLQRADGVTAAFERAVGDWQRLSSALAGVDSVGQAYAQNVATSLTESAADYFMQHGRVADATALLKRLAAAGSAKAASAVAEADAQAHADSYVHADDAQAQAQAQASSAPEHTLESIAKLVLATAHVDPATAVAHAQRLPALSTADIDVATLERLTATSLGRRRKFDEAMSGTTSDVEMKSSAAPDATARAPSAKRKKRVRYPKDYNPANPGRPDPERWLPKWERTANKKKSSKRQSAQPSLRGSQGSTAAVNVVTTSSGGVIGGIAKPVNVVAPSKSSTSSSSTSSASPAAAASAPAPAAAAAASSSASKSSKKKGKK